MTGTLLSLLLDIVIVVLLSVTIGYCWLLNKRISVLQDSKSELALLLKHFDESTLRASESIIALQTASKKIGENIQLRIDKANFLLDDMAFAQEKGEKLTNQLEASLAVNRARSKVMAEEKDTVMPPPDLPPVREPEMERFVPPSKPAQPSTKEKTSATLEAVLERVIGRGNKPANDMSPPQPKIEKSQPNLRARSRAEQELLDMIKAGIKG